MRPKIAIFGGSFNPPGTRHRLVAEALGPHFDRIIVVPAGTRPDKGIPNDVDAWHRAALADIAFRGVPKVEVDLTDLELGVFTSNGALEARYAEQGEVWHVVGSNLTAGGDTGSSPIQQSWEGGPELWRKLKFCVVARLGFSVEPKELPPQHMLLQLAHPSSGDSAEIREHIFRRLPYADQVPPHVTDYIERYGLYRGRIPARRTRWQMDHPRLLIFADERNTRAQSMAEAYRHWEDPADPNCILVLGGDGTMLRAIRTHWRRRIPFLGVNQGHLGFLLNEPEAVGASHLPRTELIVRSMPMLYVESEAPDGTRAAELAFNDAWVERSTSQSAWVEVTVNGQVRIQKLVADGVLVCTAAGTTAYARSMGVAPLLADTPGWMLVGSNVLSPPGWKSALLSPESIVFLKSSGGDKRPLCAYVDGRTMGPSVGFQARLSRIATAEVGFAMRHDMAEKIARIQFPAVEPMVI